MRTRWRTKILSIFAMGRRTIILQIIAMFYRTRRCSMLKKGLVVTGMLVVWALWGALAAHAQTSLTYNLNQDHCTSPCGPAGTISFGTVVLDQAVPGSGSVSVTVTLASGYEFNTSNGLDAFAFDLSGNVAATITGLSSDFALAGSEPSSYMEDGFGTFQYAIDCVTTCGAGGPTTLTFTVMRSALTVSDFISNGYKNDPTLFSADIYGNTTMKTGVVGASTPEPASMLLFGSGLLAIGTVVRRRLTAA
jgi:PEP-CTERM motif